MGERSGAVAVVAGVIVLGSVGVTAVTLSSGEVADKASASTASPSPSNAASPPPEPVGSLVFASSKTLELSWAALEDGATVNLCNVGAAPVLSWKRLPLELDLREDGRWLPTHKALSVSVRGTESIEVNRCDQITLSTNGEYHGRLDEGTYVGTLTVVSPQAGSAKRELSIEVPGANAFLERTVEKTSRWGGLLGPPAVLIVVALLLLGRTRFVRSRLRRRRGRFWRSLFGAQVGIDEFQPATKDDDRLGPVASVFRNGFALSDPTTSTGVDCYAETDSTLDELTSAVKELPQGKVISSLILLIQRLLPRAVYRIRGTLLPPGSRGPGLALFISRGRGREVGSITIWEADCLPRFDKIDDVATLYSIATVGAVWARYVIVQDFLEHIPPQDLGSADWESNAYFHLGAQAWFHDDEHQAEFFFARSVDRDPDHQIALFNLALSENRLGEFKQSEARLQALWAEIA